MGTNEAILPKWHEQNPHAYSEMLDATSHCSALQRAAAQRGSSFSLQPAMTDSSAQSSNSLKATVSEGASYVL